jgi:uncharacterized protein (TIGR03435 family)
MRYAMTAAALVGSLVPSPRAQAPAPPAFEVASIKPNTTGPQGPSNVFLTGARYVASGSSVHAMINFAYAPLIPRQILGAPAWTDAERFDIAAKASGNPSADTLRDMLKALLADRFKLRVHHEMRDAAIYVLVTSRADGRLGPQLKPGSVDCSAHRGDAPPRDGVPTPLPPIECNFRTTARTIAGVGIELIFAGKGITMDQLAAQLSLGTPVGRIVIDRTGLAGGFDVDLSFSSSTSNTGAAAATIFAALPEQLGLKLESRTEPVDFLVIDNVNRPTPD